MSQGRASGDGESSLDLAPGHWKWSVFELVWAPKTWKMRWGWGAGGEQDDGAHLVPGDRTTSSVIYCPSRGRAPKIRWVCGDGRIGLGEEVGVVTVADLEAGDRWEEADRGVASLVE